MKQKLPQMSKTRIELMLRVIDNHPSIPPIVYLWNQLRQCDDMLRWCIQHGFTGKQFMLWHKDVSPGSLIEASRYVIKQLEKEKVGRPLLVGKDFLT